jgi:hypothetical protein
VHGDVGRCSDALDRPARQAAKEPEGLVRTSVFRMAVQNPVQQPAAPTCGESQELTEDQNGYELALAGSGLCEMVQSDPIPPTGLEPVSSG